MSKIFYVTMKSAFDLTKQEATDGRVKLGDLQRLCKPKTSLNTGWSYQGRMSRINRNFI